MKLIIVGPVAFEMVFSSSMQMMENKTEQQQKWKRNGDDKDSEREIHKFWL